MSEPLKKSSSLADVLDLRSQISEGHGTRRMPTPLDLSSCLGYEGKVSCKKSRFPSLPALGIESKYIKRRSLSDSSLETYRQAKAASERKTREAVINNEDEENRSGDVDMTSGKQSAKETENDGDDYAELKEKTEGTSSEKGEQEKEASCKKTDVESDSVDGSERKHENTAERVETGKNNVIDKPLAEKGQSGAKQLTAAGESTGEKEERNGVSTGEEEKRNGERADEGGLRNIATDEEAMKKVMLSEYTIDHIGIERPEVGPDSKQLKKTNDQTTKAATGSRVSEKSAKSKKSSDESTDSDASSESKEITDGVDKTEKEEGEDTSMKMTKPWPPLLAEFTCKPRSYSDTGTHREVMMVTRGDIRSCRSYITLPHITGQEATKKDHPLSTLLLHQSFSWMHLPHFKGANSDDEFPTVSVMALADARDKGGSDDAISADEDDDKKTCECIPSDIEDSEGSETSVIEEAIHIWDREMGRTTRSLSEPAPMHEITSEQDEGGEGNDYRPRTLSLESYDKVAQPPSRLCFQLKLDSLHEEKAGADVEDRKIYENISEPVSINQIESSILMLAESTDMDSDSHHNMEESDSHDEVLTRWTRHERSTNPARRASVTADLSTIEETPGGSGPRALASKLSRSASMLALVDEVTQDVMDRTSADSMMVASSSTFSDVDSEESRHLIDPINFWRAKVSSRMRFRRTTLATTTPLRESHKYATQIEQQAFNKISQWKTDFAVKLDDVLSKGFKLRPGDNEDETKASKRRKVFIEVPMHLTDEEMKMMRQTMVLELKRKSISGELTSSLTTVPSLTFSLPPAAPPPPRVAHIRKISSDMNAKDLQSAMIRELRRVSCEDGNEGEMIPSKLLERLRTLHKSSQDDTNTKHITSENAISHYPDPERQHSSVSLGRVVMTRDKISELLKWHDQERAHLLDEMKKIPGLTEAGPPTQVVLHGAELEEVFRSLQVIMDSIFSETVRRLRGFDMEKSEGDTLEVQIFDSKMTQDERTEEKLPKDTESIYVETIDDLTEDSERKSPKGETSGRVTSVKKVCKEGHIQKDNVSKGIKIKKRTPRAKTLRDHTDSEISSLEQTGDVDKSDKIRSKKPSKKHRGENQILESEKTQNKGEGKEKIEKLETVKFKSKIPRYKVLRSTDIKADVAPVSRSKAVMLYADEESSDTGSSRYVDHVTGSKVKQVHAKAKEKEKEKPPEIAFDTVHVYKTSESYHLCDRATCVGPDDTSSQTRSDESETSESSEEDTGDSDDESYDSYDAEHVSHEELGAPPDGSSDGKESNRKDNVYRPVTRHRAAVSPGCSSTAESGYSATVETEETRSKEGSVSSREGRSYSTLLASDEVTDTDNDGEDQGDAEEDSERKEFDDESDACSEIADLLGVCQVYNAILDRENDGRPQAPEPMTYEEKDAREEQRKLQAQLKGQKRIVSDLKHNVERIKEERDRLRKAVEEWRSRCAEREYRGLTLKREFDVISRTVENLRLLLDEKKELLETKDKQIVRLLRTGLEGHKTCNIQLHEVKIALKDVIDENKLLKSEVRKFQMLDRIKNLEEDKSEEGEGTSIKETHRSLETAQSKDYLPDNAELVVALERKEEEMAAIKVQGDMRYNTIKQAFLAVETERDALNEKVSRLETLNQDAIKETEKSLKLIGTEREALKAAFQRISELQENLRDKQEVEAALHKNEQCMAIMKVQEDERYNAIKRSILEVEKERDAVKQDQSRLEAVNKCKIEELEELLKRQNIEVDVLREEREKSLHLLQKFTVLQQKKEDLTSHVVELQERLQKAEREREKEAQSKEIEVSNLKKKVMDLEGENLNFGNQIAEKEDEVCQAKKLVEWKAKEIHALKSSVSALETLVQKLSEENGFYKRESEEMKASEARNDDHDQMEAKFTDVTHEHQETVERLSETRKTLDEVSEMASKEIERKDRELSMIRNQNEELQRQNTNLKKLLNQRNEIQDAELLITITELQSKLSQKDKEVMEFRNRTQKKLEEESMQQHLPALQRRTDNFGESRILAAGIGVSTELETTLNKSGELYSLMKATGDMHSSIHRRTREWKEAVETQQKELDKLRRLPDFGGIAPSEQTTPKQDLDATEKLRNDIADLKGAIEEFVSGGREFKVIPQDQLGMKLELKEKEVDRLEHFYKQMLEMKERSHADVLKEKNHIIQELSQSRSETLRREAGINFETFEKSVKEAVELEIRKQTDELKTFLQNTSSRQTQDERTYGMVKDSLSLNEAVINRLEDTTSQTWSKVNTEIGQLKEHTFQMADLIEKDVYTSQENITELVRYMAEDIKTNVQEEVRGNKDLLTDGLREHETMISEMLEARQMTELAQLQDLQASLDGTNRRTLEEVQQVRKDVFRAAEAVANTAMELKKVKNAVLSVLAREELSIDDIARQDKMTEKNKEVQNLRRNASETLRASLTLKAMEQEYTAKANTYGTSLLLKERELLDLTRNPVKQPSWKPTEDHVTNLGEVAERTNQEMSRLRQTIADHSYLTGVELESMRASSAKEMTGKDRAIQLRSMQNRFQTPPSRDLSRSTLKDKLQQMVTTRNTAKNAGNNEGMPESSALSHTRWPWDATQQASKEHKHYLGK